MYTNAPTKQPKTLAWALLTAGIALSDAVTAADTPPTVPGADLLNQWAQMVVYAVTPYCQVLQNGLRVCQPIGLVGPAPNSPAAAYQPLVRVPLAPPFVQPPGMQSFAYPPYGANPFMPGQAIPYLPWHGAVASPQTATVAPAPGQEATLGLPSIVQPSVQPVTPAAASPEPMTSEPHAQQHAAAPVASVATDTVPPAPAVTASASTAEPAVADTAATKAAADAAIAHFEFDRAELTEAGRAALDAWLARNVKLTRVVVTGHADRLGSAAYNMDLSRRRAEAARDYLVHKGLDPRLITLVAMGETRPVKHCKGRPSPATIACLAPNRRVVIGP